MDTLDPCFSNKSILLQKDQKLKENIRKDYILSSSIYDKLFESIACEEAYYLKPEPLRHPLIFYYGHTAAVYINKLYEYGMIKNRVNPAYEKIFAAGVDEMDWDDLDQKYYPWPTIAETKKFKEKVHKVMLETIEQLQVKKITDWHNEIWVILLVIQHERIHLETSAVIIRRLPVKMVREVQNFIECPIRQTSLQKIRKNKICKVQAWKGKWKSKIKMPKTFGWDNEFGEKQFNVSEFKASEMLVSNGEFLEFVNAGGYNHPEWWTEEGRKWIASIKPQMPLFWRKQGDSYRLRTLFQEISMPWDWPAEVNNLEARAFCKWRTEKTGKYTRLPTEDEYYALRSLLPKDQPEWEYQEVGNINLEYWMSPNPVNLFKTGDFYDIVGNVWQHTITPIYPFGEFQYHPAYEDFATPGFDDNHDLIKGGSFISVGCCSLYQARNPFRRHFYQFAGFRYTEEAQQMEVDLHEKSILKDNEIEKIFKIHYVKENSYISEVVKELKNKCHHSKNKKALTVGCSAGRIVYQLGNLFDESIGIDNSAKYFPLLTKLKETKCLSLKDSDIKLKDINIQGDNVQFFKINPSNPEESKISNCSFIFIDGFSIRKGTIQEVIKNIMSAAHENTTLAILNVEGVNQIDNEIVPKLLEPYKRNIQVYHDKKISASFEDFREFNEHPSDSSLRLTFFKLTK